MQTESVIRGHSPWDKAIHAQSTEQPEAVPKTNEVSGNSSNPSSSSSPTQRAETPPNNWKTIKPPNGSTIGSEDSPRTPDSEGALSFRSGVPRTQTPPSLLGKDPLRRGSPNSNILPVKQPVASGLSPATSIWGSLGTQWNGGSIWNDSSSARTPSPSKPGATSTVSDNQKNSSIEEHGSAFNELDEPIPPYRQQRSFSIAIGEETSDFFGSMSRFRASNLDNQDRYQHRGALPPMDEELTESEYASMMKPRIRSQSAFMFPAPPQQSQYPEESLSHPPGFEEIDQVSEMNNMWSNNGGIPEAAMYRRRSIANPVSYGNLWDNNPPNYPGNSVPPPNNIAYAQALATERLERMRQQRRFSLAPSYPMKGPQDPMNAPQSIFGRPNGLVEPDYSHLNYRRHSVAAPTLASLHPGIQPHSSRFLSGGLESLHLEDSRQNGQSPYNSMGDDMDDYFVGDEHRQSRPYAEIGKGVPLHALPSQGPLYIVEFKAGRTDVFYTTENCGFATKMGDLVIVEADRGKDLGKVVNDTITPQQVQMLQAQQQQQQQQQLQHNPDGNGELRPGKEVQPKMIYRLAQPGEIALLVTKNQDEAKAMLVCQTKVRQKKLPMEVVDAEYQWDRRKLTFYFIAERRIDFRELVRDLFKLYKTRIWMCAVNPMTAKVGKI